ncbi:acyltransferase [Oceanobacillus sp. AG]|uniref:acyltransferase n=1 Tax=Oceanobacillus sp. AG TaxID=2681969 RepID=UPI0012EB93E6|nr:acyltransferase [Oceanobacillus sp. AG]
MSGRDLIRKFNYILRLLEGVSKLIPQSIFSFIWNTFDRSESKISLLLRYLYVKKYAATCGENIFIGKGVILKNIHNLKLGSNISIHAYSYIDSYGGITIKDNVSIAHHSSIISFEHTWDDKELPIKYNNLKENKVEITEDVWIGSGCRILSGVKINKRCVVAAGAVVNSSVKPNSLVAGVPARKIKDIY